MAYIKTDSDGRITAASHTCHCGDGEIEVVIPDAIGMENIHESRYADGEFVHDPIPALETEATPTQIDRIEAQALYTAMMTDTLLEG